jgi:N-acetyl-alpha-D-glucosaminyl L-malate synthase BshA
MRIGITCYPTYGGSGVIATELGKALAERGHIIHFISYAMPFRLTRFNKNIMYHEVDVSTYPLFDYQPYSISLASKMADVVRFENLDLLHVHYAIPHALSAFMAKEILRDKNDPKQNVKIVTTLHGTDVTVVGIDPSFAGAVRLGLNKSDGITAVSNYLKQTTEQDFTPVPPVTFIPNFIDPKKVKRTENPTFRKNFAEDNEKIVIHISNFRPLKRTGDVIRIFEKLSKTVPARLLMVGDGPERPEDEKLVRDLGLASRVLFLGKQEDIVELLSVSDLFLIPSESETFGLAALEAMACRIPVIATRIGGLPELIEDGVTGCLHPLGDVDAMAECSVMLLQDTERHKRFADNAFEKALTYRTEKIIPLYETYYQQILQK